MGLWHCPEHGLVGPEACCGKASFATLSMAKEVCHACQDTGIVPMFQWDSVADAPRKILVQCPLCKPGNPQSGVLLETRPANYQTGFEDGMAEIQAASDIANGPDELPPHEMWVCPLHGLSATGNCCKLAAAPPSLANRKPLEQIGWEVEWPNLKWEQESEPRKAKWKQITEAIIKESGARDRMEIARLNARLKEMVGAEHDRDMYKEKWDLLCVEIDERNSTIENLRASFVLEKLIVVRLQEEVNRLRTLSLEEENIHATLGNTRHIQESFFEEMKDTHPENHRLFREACETHHVRLAKIREERTVSLKLLFESFDKLKEKKRKPDDDWVPPEPMLSRSEEQFEKLKGGPR